MIDLEDLSPKGKDPARTNYSCNCGFIDWGHARVENSRKLWPRILCETHDTRYGTVQIEGHPAFSVSYYQEMKYGQVHECQFAVRRGISSCQKESVALAIMRYVAVGFETLQSKWPYSIKDSHFSAEDFISDTLSFYQDIKGITKPEVVRLGKVVSESASIAVWKSYVENSSNFKEKDWDRPRLFPCSECSGTPSFPVEFRTITPAMIPSLDVVEMPRFIMSDALVKENWNLHRDGRTIRSW